MKNKAQEKWYIVYDERAIIMDTEDASVMVACESLEEARSYRGQFGLRCAIYSYDVDGEDLVNEQFVEVLEG